MEDYEIEEAFTYHPPKEEQSEIYEEIRNHAKILAKLYKKMVPHSREQSLALTKLRESVMWANAGVAING